MWMSDDGRFIDGMSARLLDFSFPGSQDASALAQQWEEHPETLCRAPARQQFYNSTQMPGCVPFYPPTMPDGRDGRPEKNPDGTDANFNRAMGIWNSPCVPPGQPFNSVDLLNKPLFIEIPKSTVFSDHLNLGPLAP